MIPGYLITKKTSWRFDDLGGFRATFLGPKLDFFSCEATLSTSTLLLKGTTSGSLLAREIDVWWYLAIP